MHKTLKFCLFMLVGVQAFGQFVNNGATVTIQPGATLRVETSFINNTGTVTNNGTLEVQDNFDNSATFFSGTSSIVRFIGAANSNVKSNAAVLRNIEMSKTAQNITLLDPLTISGDINFVNDNNKVVLANNNFKINAGGTVISSDANEYFATTGTGNLLKPISANGTYTSEVGDLTNYTPITTAITATGYASASTEVRVTDATHPNKPAPADAFISRYWTVNLPGVTGLTSNVMTGTYAAVGDVVGTPQNSIKGASFISPNWTYTAAATNGTSTVTGSTNALASSFTGMKDNFNISLTAFIEGFMDGVTPNMKPVLQLSGVAGATGSQADTVTLELHNAIAPYALIAARKAVLSTAGVGTFNFPMSAASLPTTYFAVKHRNGLETWSKVPVTFAAATAYNFSTGVAQAFGDNLVLKNTRYCMYSGDMTLVQDGSVDIVDYPIWESDYNNFESGYRRADLNGDGNVDIVDYPTWEANYNGFVSVAKP